MPQAFGYPFMYWVGMNTPPGMDAATLATFNDFYSDTHVPEVVANNPGFVRGSRYELLGPDPRGDFGPRWLAVYEMTNQAAADTYTAGADRAAQNPAFTPGPPGWRDVTIVWRMIWRQLSERGAATEPPTSIFVVGIDVPANTDGPSLTAFNNFYDETHVPEVMGIGGYARGTRFERYQAFAHPAPGCPQFCAVYEADAATTVANEGRPAAPGRAPGGRSFTPGPAIWEQHNTLWRLVYRRISG
ncbi:MAG: hypothetical protein JO057_07445 [Chloroflexi bacterium]|nr:hypothetical protein [Chloroflexota bacterium]